MSIARAYLRMTVWQNDGNFDTLQHFQSQNSSPVKIHICSVIGSNSCIKPKILSHCIFGRLSYSSTRKRKLQVLCFRDRKGEGFILLLCKGQLISKCLFGVFNFFQKMNENNQPNYYGTSSWIVFVRFLKNLKTPKRHFEINWPLQKSIKNDFTQGK